MVTKPLTGGCIRRGRRLSANCPIAPSQAVSVSAARTSRSMEGAIRRSYASSVAARTNAVEAQGFFTVRVATNSTATSRFISTETFNTSSRSPRFMAST